MSLQAIATGFGKVKQRVNEIATRMRGYDERLAKLERSFAQLVPDPSAVEAVPNSPIHELSETFVARVTGADPVDDTFYLAVRQQPTGLGTWEDDPDDVDPIRVATLPKLVVGQDPDYATNVVEGQLVYVRWDGRDDSTGDEFYTVVAPVRGPACFRLFGVGSDTLQGWRILSDGSESSRLEYIWKPWQLRASTWDGKTYGGMSYTCGSEARTVENPTSGVTESQIIVPPYWVKNEISNYPGDVIVAIPLPAGEQTTVTIVDAECRVNWLALNDGRAWMENYTS